MSLKPRIAFEKILDHHVVRACEFTMACIDRNFLARTIDLLSVEK
jgi:hypothetical protein